MIKEILVRLLFLSLIVLFSCQSNQSHKSDGSENETAAITDSFFSTNTAEMIPLIDMKAEYTYKGESGGLYGYGSNEIPPSHLNTIANKLNEIKPIDGKIGFLSIGMSNTSYEFKYFMRLVDRDKNKSDYLYLCNGAQGGATADVWAESSSRAWGVLDERLSQSNLSPDQVQIIWLKTAHREPLVPMPDINSDAVKLEKDIISIINILKVKFVNLKIIYLSSRIYAGYAITKLNPEPFAYESGFSVRNVILQQINGNEILNPKTTPALVWGPYLWANGEKTNSQGLNWTNEDYDPKDFTHPRKGSGIEKVGNILYDFFTKDEFAKTFYYK